MANAARAALRLRFTPRTWTILMALVAVPLGAFLLVGPVRELATGRTFGLQSLITLSWLVTGGATLAAGLGILLRARPYRKFLLVAFFCSLPLVATFAYRTFTLAVKMRSSTGETQTRLEPFVAGGVQLSLFFLTVSAFLFFLLRFRHLRSLQCSGSVLQGRAGPYVGTGVGVVAGIACGYLVWLSSRILGYQMDVAAFRNVLNVFPVDYFVYTGAVIGGAAVLVKWRRGRTRRPHTPAPSTP